MANRWRRLPEEQRQRKLVALCGGNPHTVLIHDGKIQFPDHPNIPLSVLRAIGEIDPDHCARYLTKHRPNALFPGNYPYPPIRDSGTNYIGTFGRRTPYIASALARKLSSVGLVLFVGLHSSCSDDLLRWSEGCRRSECISVWWRDLFLIEKERLPHICCYREECGIPSAPICIQSILDRYMTVTYVIFLGKARGIRLKRVTLLKHPCYGWICVQDRLAARRMASKQ